MFYRGTEITPKELFSVFKMNALESRKMTRGIRELIFLSFNKKSCRTICLFKPLII